MHTLQSPNNDVPQENTHWLRIWNNNVKISYRSTKSITKRKKYPIILFDKRQIAKRTTTHISRHPPTGRGIRGTHLKPSIQDIVDEVAAIKEAPYGVEGRFIQM